MVDKKTFKKAKENVKIDFTNAMSNEFKHFYEFEKFRFSPKEKSLWYEETLISISPKALDVLNLLLEKHPEVVTREEIIEKVWKDTFIEEANINVAVSNLRKTFEKESSEKFIQTIPKKGYRFIADVKKISTENQTEKASSETVSIKENLPIQNKVSRWYLLTIILVGIFFLTSFAFWFQYKDDSGFSSVPINKRNIKSIAVLPLKHLNDNETNRAISMGLTDNLITRLGKLNRFVIRPLSAVEKFSEGEKDAIQFGKELQVDSVVVGTIQSKDNRLRLNARLLDVRDGAQIWAESFDVTEEDIFKLQDKLSLQVADNLIADISDKETQKLKQRETVSPKAFQAYSKGKFYLAKRTVEDIKKAIELFEEAVKIDENYADSYTGIAKGYLLLSDSTFLASRPLEHADKIEKAINKSLTLNPDSAEAYVNKASFHTLIQWNTEAAEKNYKKAISLNPNIAQTHHWYAWVLLTQKRFEEAEKEMKTAHKLDPTSRIIATEKGLPLLYAEKYKESLPYFRQAVEMDGNFLQARFRLWYVLHLMEKYDEAFEELEAIKRLTSENNHFYLALYGMTKAKSGQKPEAIEIYDQLKKRAEDEYISPVLLSGLATMIGNKDAAFEWLDDAFEERNDYLLYLEMAPDYKDLRDDSRFENLLNKINRIKENNSSS